MVTALANNDPDFGDNPQQALLQAISDVTCQHLYTRPRSLSTEKEDDKGNPQDENAVDEESKKVR
eukprot:6115137-Karenia_brevis.AAC.1